MEHPRNEHPTEGAALVEATETDLNTGPTVAAAPNNKENQDAMEPDEDQAFHEDHQELQASENASEMHTEETPAVIERALLEQEAQWNGSMANQLRTINPPEEWVMTEDLAIGKGQMVESTQPTSSKNPKSHEKEGVNASSAGVDASDQHPGAFATTSSKVPPEDREKQEAINEQTAFPTSPPPSSALGESFGIEPLPLTRGARSVEARPGAYAHAGIGTAPTAEDIAGHSEDPQLVTDTAGSSYLASATLVPEEEDNDDENPRALQQEPELVEAMPALKGFRAIWANKRFKYIAALFVCVFLVAIIVIVVPVVMMTTGNDDPTSTSTNNATSVLVCGTRQSNQADYRGTIGTTESHRTCQRWDVQEPHSHSYTNDTFAAGGLTENYCRNPEGDAKPWCYTDGMATIIIVARVVLCTLLIMPITTVHLISFFYSLCRSQHAMGVVHDPLL